MKRYCEVFLYFLLSVLNKQTHAFHLKSSLSGLQGSEGWMPVQPSPPIFGVNFECDDFSLIVFLTCLSFIFK